MASRKLDFIQGLRGIAAFMVVLHHARTYIDSSEGTSELASSFFYAGYFGVDLFFVISGFIMVITTWGSDGSSSYVKDYFIKRVSRIVPVYSVLTFLCIFTVFNGIYFFHSPENVDILFRSLLYIPQTLIDQRPYYGGPTLYVGWTLNYEMYFYIIFGVSLLFKSLRWIALSLIIIATLILIPLMTRGSFSLNPFVMYDYKIMYINMMTNPIIWFFASGVAIGIMYKSNISIKSKTTCWVITLSCSLFLMWQYFSGYKVNHGIAFCGLSVIPFVAAITLSSKTIDISFGRIAEKLGDISFSLYLIHISIFAIIDKVSMYLGTPTHGLWYFIVLSISAIIAAMISHSLLEVKLSSYMRSLLERALFRSSVIDDVSKA